jgi:hypothetical protein
VFGDVARWAPAVLLPPAAVLFCVMAGSTTRPLFAAAGDGGTAAGADTGSSFGAAAVHDSGTAGAGAAAGTSAAAARSVSQFPTASRRAFSAVAICA